MLIWPFPWKYPLPPLLDPLQIRADPDIVHHRYYVDDNYRAMRSFRTTTRRRVNVICSHTNNPLTPLRAFWATLTMNFLTPRGGACGFPVGTLNYLGALKKEPLTSREDHSRQLYERHGFLFGSDNVREALGIWDVLFFGQPRLLAVDFRTDLALAECTLPIIRRRRGWLPNPAWNKISAV